MMGTLLQICNPSKGFQEYMQDFSFAHAITCQYANASDILFVGTMVFGGVCLFSYLRTGSVIIPLGMVMFTGGAVTQFLPATPLRLMGIALMISAPGVIAYAHYRYNR